MNPDTPCLCCGESAAKLLVDFGPQPPSNRFELPEAPAAETHPLKFAQCQSCGLLQLQQPMAVAMAKSRFEWLNYNEPEGHLDDLVSRLQRLPGLDRQSRIAAVTYKDDTTLDRFNRLGYANTHRLDLATDLGLKDACAGLESIQGALDAATARRLAARHGLADLLLVRHVLEHAHQPLAFIRAAAALVRPGGYLLFEMPDCEKFVQAGDYSFVWEEHITYFSRHTLAAFIAAAGMTLHETIVYPYPLEDSLIGVVRNAQPEAGRSAMAAGGLAQVLDQGRRFADGYTPTRVRLQQLLAGWVSSGRRVAVFGAGHLAAKFINLYGLRDYIECVIDDNAQKQSLLMPGSRLPIRGSSVLADRSIGTCLLSLNPESEQKVRSKNQSYLDRGGEFQSIFALSPSSVYRAIAG